MDAKEKQGTHDSAADIAIRARQDSEEAVRRSAIKALPSPPKFVFRVIRDDELPARRASVFLTRERLRKTPVIQDRAWMDDYGVVHWGFTDKTGKISFPPSEEKVVCHVRVEGARGIIAFGGPHTVDMSSPPNHPLVYTIGGVRAAAITMSDGSVIEHSRWEFDSVYPLGMQSSRLDEMRRELARRLSLSWGQVFVDAGAFDSRERIKSKVAIFHPRIGWFRHEVTLGNYESVTPTVIPPPASGAGSPVRVSVDCFAPDGSVCEISGIRLHGVGSVPNFPRIVACAASGQEIVVPTGRYVIQFKDAALTHAHHGPRVVELNSDQRLELKLRWTARRIQVTVVRGKEPVRGRAYLTVQAGKDQLYRRQYVDIRDGKIAFSVPKERESKATIKLDGETTMMEFDANSDKTEYRIEL